MSLRPVWELPDGCWVTSVKPQKDGYVRIRYNKRSYGAHRAFYDTLVGPVADGMDVDHVCHFRACVNPSHLRLVSHSVNQLNQSPKQRKNGSGPRGVGFYKATGRWRARYSVGGKQVLVGWYDTAEEAEAELVLARQQAGHLH